MEKEQCSRKMRITNGDSSPSIPSAVPGHFDKGLFQTVLSMLSTAEAAGCG